MNRRLGAPLVALLLALAFVAALPWLPLAAAFALGALFSLGGVVLLQRPAWRTASLVLASTLLGLAGLNVAFWFVNPPAQNQGEVKVTGPEGWNIVDPVVGYRLRSNIEVDARASYDGELLYHTTYTIDPSGARLTPGSGPQGPTYLFIGDSLIFGEGLPDDQTMVARFAQGLHPPAHVVNLGVIGYGPNNVVRGLETGYYDSHVVGRVKAAITWIAPWHVERVTGDAGWMADSPRYELQADGGLRYTGSFAHHRLTHPLDGASWLARSELPWVARAMHASLFREQTALYVALLGRMAELVHQRFDAPLLVIINWPEREAPGQNDLDFLPAYRAIVKLGLPLISVRQLMGPSDQWGQYIIAHDGHPNARLAAMVAAALAKTLEP